MTMAADGHMDVLRSCNEYFHFFTSTFLVLRPAVFSLYFSDLLAEVLTCPAAVGYMPRQPSRQASQSLSLSRWLRTLPKRLRTFFPLAAAKEEGRLKEKMFLGEGGGRATGGDEGFSNVWKNRSEKFQWLEKSPRNFPMLGKLSVRRRACLRPR